MFQKRNIKIKFMVDAKIKIFRPSFLVLHNKDLFYASSLKKSCRKSSKIL